MNRIASQDFRIEFLAHLLLGHSLAKTLVQVKEIFFCTVTGGIHHLQGHKMSHESW